MYCSSVGGFSLAKRVRTHNAEVMARLTNEATKLFAEGKLAEAKAKAQEAVGLAHSRHPRNTARAHFCLGRVLFRLGELEEAEVHLAKALELDSDPHRRALAATKPVHGAGPAGQIGGGGRARF